MTSTDFTVDGNSDIKTSSSDIWPLEGIRIKTIMKIVNCDVFFHKNFSPYFQISIDGFILSSGGDVMLANVQVNLDKVDSDQVKVLIKLYVPQSIHWLESSDFYVVQGEYQFYNAVINKVDAKLYQAINDFFPVAVGADREANDGEFWYSGTVYVPGGGDIAYGRYSNRTDCNGS